MRKTHNVFSIEMLIYYCEMRKKNWKVTKIKVDNDDNHSTSKKNNP